MVFSVRGLSFGRPFCPRFCWPRTPLLPEFWGAAAAALARCPSNACTYTTAWLLPQMTLCCVFRVRALAAQVASVTLSLFLLAST